MNCWTLTFTSTVQHMQYSYHLLTILFNYFLAGQQEAATPPSQPAPHFTSAEVRRYQRRLEEGYDVPDPGYVLWLESVGVGDHASTPSSIDASTAHRDDEPKSGCQTGECGHTRARQWIGCDRCPRWYHCLCTGLSHKKAKSASYTCSACS